MLNTIAKAPSMVVSPLGFVGYSDAFFDFMKTWVKSSNKSNINPTDWRVWLPRAFYLNWSDPKTLQKSIFDLTIWLPMAFYPQEERERILQIYNIAGDYVERDKAAGDIIEGIKNHPKA
jgi:hypothetical protein